MNKASIAGVRAVLQKAAAPRVQPAAMPSWSRLIRFTPSEDRSKILIGEPVDATLDVGLANYAGDEILVHAYAGTSILAPGERTGEKFHVGGVLCPLAEHEVGTIRGIGLNVSPLSWAGEGTAVSAVDAVFCIPTRLVRVALTPACTL